MYYQILIKDAFQEPLPSPAFFHHPTTLVPQGPQLRGWAEGKGWGWDC